ncbi:MAG: hypothetical protein IKV17_05795 [Bacteroidaceae bacterium]|nr:hypothetical protein [Bacteroidaceae bacterium]
MKKIILSIAIILLTTTANIAQERKSRFSREEYKNKQKEFIIQQAKLTTEESEAFFPLFFELQDKKHTINSEAHKKVGVKKGEKATEEQWVLLVNEYAEAKIKIAELEKEYIAKYLAIVPAEKVLGVQRAESMFQKELLKQMTNRRKDKK